MAVQVIERKATGWSVSAFGTTYEVLARSGLVADLSQHMKPPPKSALDGALLSPMPGTLLSVSVEVKAACGVPMLLSFPMLLSSPTLLSFSTLLSFPTMLSFPMLLSFPAREWSGMTS